MTFTEIVSDIFMCLNYLHDPCIFLALSSRFNSRAGVDESELIIVIARNCIRWLGGKRQEKILKYPMVAYIDIQWSYITIKLPVLYWWVSFHSTYVLISLNINPLNSHKKHNQRKNTFLYNSLSVLCTTDLCLLISFLIRQGKLKFRLTDWTCFIIVDPQYKII